MKLKLLRLITIKTTKSQYNYRQHYKVIGEYECPICSATIRLAPCYAKRNKSCGCRNPNYRHGLSKDGGLYTTWKAMNQRCHNKNSKAYKHYGGRGITICQEWKGNFRNFRLWAISNGWVDGLSIDRINNDGNYEPSNCRFITLQENCRVSRQVKLNWITVAEIRQLRSAGVKPKILAAQYGVTRQAIWAAVTGKNWNTNNIKHKKTS